MSDIYRDLGMRGGIPDIPLSATGVDDFIGKTGARTWSPSERHPLMGEFWETKDPGFEKIDGRPTSWQLLQLDPHARTFRGWRRSPPGRSGCVST